jgi:hypothetical protein
MARGGVALAASARPFLVYPAHGARLERAEVAAWVAEKHRPATSRPSKPAGSSARYGTP